MGEGKVTPYLEGDGTISLHWTPLAQLLQMELYSFL